MRIKLAVIWSESFSRINQSPNNIEPGVRQKAKIAPTHQPEFVC